MATREMAHGLFSLLFPKKMLLLQSRALIYWKLWTSGAKVRPPRPPG
jgi:hypothetical protein